MLYTDLDMLVDLAWRHMGSAQAFTMTSTMLAQGVMSGSTQASPTAQHAGSLGTMYHMESVRQYMAFDQVCKAGTRGTAAHLCRPYRGPAAPFTQASRGQHTWRRITCPTLCNLHQDTTIGGTLGTTAQR